MEKPEPKNEDKIKNSQSMSKFVIDILDYSLKKKVDEKTNDRLIRLIGQEIEKTGLNKNEILERVQRLEELIIPVQPSVKDKKKPSPKPPRPIETKNFLSLFNNSEGLKYLTHKFNDGKRDYDIFMGLCRIEFDEGKIKYPNVPDAVLKRIEEFAFKENPEWYIRNGEDKIYPNKGWSETSFVEWYKQEINIHPGYDAKWNSEMVIPFKETIEVRAGNLTSIINSALNSKTGLGDSKGSFDIKINVKEINTAEFYTDVDSFKYALSHIFSTIKERANKNFCYEIEVDFINETLQGGKYKKLIITHINSEPTKNGNDSKFISGDLNTIRKNLWGLCNYEVQGKFPEGYRAVTILSDEDKAAHDIQLNSTTVRGFTHVLKFY